MHYEDVAASYLEKHGYKIVMRNFRTRQGEIDIIAQHDGYLVFIEVKYRGDAMRGKPWEAVGRGKQDKIRIAAKYYLVANHYSEFTPVRFDVVSIAGKEIKVFENAFW